MSETAGGQADRTDDPIEGGEGIGLTMSDDEGSTFEPEEDPEEQR
jgi:hypothetical protein